MALRFQQGNWWRLDNELQRRLRGLTRKKESGIRDILRDIEEGKVKSHKVFILFENEVPVSWVLTCYNDYSNEYELMVYTKRSHRRRGYGRKLIQKARYWINKQNKGVCFYPDSDSEKFWLSMFSRDDVDAMYGLMIYDKIN